MPATQLNSLFLKLAVFIPVIFISANLFGAENPVTVSKNENSFTLANGIVTALVTVFLIR